MDEKTVGLYTDKLKKNIDKDYKIKDIESVMAGIASVARINYHYNQIYKDDFLEKYVQMIADGIKVHITRDELSKNTILFYDWFGYDVRGLAYIYLKAILHNGYRLVYVTKDSAKRRQTEIFSLFVDRTVDIIYFSEKDSYLNNIKQLTNTIEQYRPAYMFYYTCPYDPAGAVTFTRFKGIITRFQIDLTDHTAWLGLNTFDYIIEFREYGGLISCEYRGINRDKIRILPYYPCINYEMKFQGFPFDRNGKKVVFSGGALYKTIDKENTYYKIVEELLSYNSNIVFLFAGAGPHEMLDKLEIRFPGRVYHIPERKDLYQLMKNSDLYLSTYPFAGGLMIQYAVMASCIPLTLQRKGANDIDGILREQDSSGLFFTDIDELKNTAKRILNDEEYAANLKNSMQGRIITEKEFEKELNNIIEERSTNTQMTKLHLNTSQFRNGMKENFTRFDIYRSIARKKNKVLIKKYPWIFLLRILESVKK